MGEYINLKAVVGKLFKGTESVKLMNSNLNNLGWVEKFPQENKYSRCILGTSVLKVVENHDHLCLLKIK